MIFPRKWQRSERTRSYQYQFQTYYLKLTYYSRDFNNIIVRRIHDNARFLDRNSKKEI